MQTRGLWGLVILALLLAPMATALAAPPEARLIDAATLKVMLGNPQVMIIDVRVPSAYADSDKIIKGAVHQDPGKVPTWAQTLPKDKKIVLYCSWANEHTSARVAQQLLQMKFTQVEVLKGGWNGWLKGGYPTGPKK